MGLLAAALTGPLAFALPQQPAEGDERLPTPPPPEVVLAADADPVPLRAFGLGSGGLDEQSRPGALRWAEAGCTTPGGIGVQCRPAGVKLEFPSGRELLVAPDGFVHVRGGGAAGPFAAGLELRLGDGSAVRVLLSQAQRRRLRSVVVVHGDRALQPWRRGRPAREIARVGFWGGLRLCCCGDGGDLYRAVAIGPLITLDRVLVPDGREDRTPPERLVVLTRPMLRALAQVPRHHRTPDPALRAAVTAVSATAQHGGRIFPAGASLRRAERDDLRWALRAGYELQLALDGPRAPRLSLYAGRSARPMVEWALAMNSAVFLNNPGADQPGAPRWRGNGVAMPVVAPELQARSVLFEHGYALGVLRRLRAR